MPARSRCGRVAGAPSRHEPPKPSNRHEILVEVERAHGRGVCKTNRSRSVIGIRPVVSAPWHLQARAAILPWRPAVGEAFAARLTTGAHCRRARAAASLGGTCVFCVVAPRPRSTARNDEGGRQHQKNVNPPHRPMPPDVSHSPRARFPRPCSRSRESPAAPHLVQWPARDGFAYQPSSLARAQRISSPTAHRRFGDLLFVRAGLAGG